MHIVLAQVENYPGDTFVRDLMFIMIVFALVIGSMLVAAKRAKDRADKDV